MVKNILEKEHTHSQRVPPQVLPTYGGQGFRFLILQSKNHVSCHTFVTLSSMLTMRVWDEEVPDEAETFTRNVTR